MGGYGIWRPKSKSSWCWWNESSSFTFQYQQRTSWSCSWRLQHHDWVTIKVYLNTCWNSHVNVLIFSSPGANGEWIYEDPAIEVKNGDTVYYWILVMVNGGGYQVMFLPFHYKFKPKSYQNPVTFRKLTYPLFSKLLSQPQLQQQNQQHRQQQQAQQHRQQLLYQQQLLHLYQSPCLNWWNLKVGLFWLDK